MPPEQLSASLWPNALNATIIAPTEHTYHSGDNATLIDFFVASNCLLPGYKTTTTASLPTYATTDVNHTAPTGEHSIVTFHFAPGAAALKVPMLRKYQRYPLDPATGPRVAVPEDILHAAHCATQKAMHSATTDTQPSRIQTALRYGYLEAMFALETDISLATHVPMDSDKPRWGSAPQIQYQANLSTNEASN